MSIPRRRQNYRSGRELEWAYRKKLEADGFAVMRSAGSKGPFDLIAWSHGWCLHVQLKRRLTESARRKLWDELADQVAPGCLVRVVHLDKEGGFCEH